MARLARFGRANAGVTVPCRTTWLQAYIKEDNTLYIIQVLLCAVFLLVIFRLKNQIINIHKYSSFSKNKWRRAQHSKLILFSTHRLAGEPQTSWVYSAYNGADGEFRNLDLRIIVVIVRFELTFPYWMSFLDETTQVRCSASELHQHIKGEGI